MAVARGDFLGFVDMLAEWRAKAISPVWRLNSSRSASGRFAAEMTMRSEMGGTSVANTKQRVVVVTGGAAGIGAAIAEELGRDRRVRGHNGSGRFGGRIEPHRRARADDGGEDRRRRRSSAGVEHLGDRPRGGQGPVRRAGRRVRLARRRGQRRRYQPSDGLRLGDRRGLGGRPQRAPRRLPQRAPRRTPDHDRRRGTARSWGSPRVRDGARPMSGRTAAPNGRWRRSPGRSVGRHPRA